jgi:hypothetical protein
MRFTEHELTVGLSGAAKYVLALQNREIRRGAVDVEDYWNSLEKFARFQILDGLSDQVLPVLIALPDLEIAPGGRAEYSDAQIKVTVEEATGQVVGLLKRAATIRARIDLVKAALRAMPPRQDPDALIVPDHL